MVNKVKKTEFGIIPEEWDVFKLGDCSNIYRGGSPRPIQDYITTSDNGVNWIKIGDVKAGDKYITSTEEKIIPEGISMSREVKVGDFILSNSMSFGRPYILKMDGCIHDGWLVIQNYQSKYDAEYLYYLLSSEFVFAQYKKLAAGSGVQNLNKDIVTEVMLPHPDKIEQEAIALVLSSMDELINNLEKEIEKKKNIQIGIMQEYLTGKRKLSKYENSVWEKKKICELGYLVKNSINPQDYLNELFWEYSMPAYDNEKTPNKTRGDTMNSMRLAISAPVLLFNKLISCVESLNREISVDESLGEGFSIGHSYFCNLQPDAIDDSWLYGVVEYELIPLLKEYWFDEPMKVKNWSENLRSTIK